MNSKKLVLKGIKTHCISFESPKNTSTLFMLHGWGGSHKSFLSLGEKIFSQEKINIVIPDLPGFGESEIPNNWSTHEYCEWLEALLKEYKSQEILFYGHSFGCRVILRFLEKHPEFKNKVILTGAAGIHLPPTLREQITRITKKFLGFLKNYFPQKIKLFLLKKVFRANDWASCPEKLKSTFQKVLSEEDLRTIAQKVRTQILLIWGKNDTYTPLQSGEIYHQSFPHSVLKILPQGKHGIHYTHETEILKFIHEFLKNS